MKTSRETAGWWARVSQWADGKTGVLILAGFTATWVILMGLMMWLAFVVIGVAR